MATCEDIITTAFRRLRILDESEAPSADHGTVGLYTLQSLFDQAVNAARLTDVVATAAYTAGENERIRLDGGAWTITYPETIADDGDRDPTDLAVVVVAGTTPVHKHYDAQLGDWVTVSGLALSTVCPLSQRNRAGIAAALAEALAGEYGKDISRELKADAARGRSLLNRLGAPRTYVETKFY